MNIALPSIPAARSLDGKVIGSIAPDAAGAMLPSARFTGKLGEAVTSDQVGTAIRPLETAFVTALETSKKGVSKGPGVLKSVLSGTRPLPKDAAFPIGDLPPGNGASVVVEGNPLVVEPSDEPMALVSSPARQLVVQQDIQNAPHGKALPLAESLSQGGKQLPLAETVADTESPVIGESGEVVVLPSDGSAQIGPVSANAPGQATPLVVRQPVQSRATPEPALVQAALSGSLPADKPTEAPKRGKSIEALAGQNAVLSQSLQHTSTSLGFNLASNLVSGEAFGTIGQTALAPGAYTPNANAPAASAPSNSPVDVRPSPSLDQAIEQLSQTREAGRAARPEMLVRNAEFGLVAMRIDAGSGDLRATLSNRDPGFVPAVQAMLAERAVVAANDATSMGQRGTEGGQGQNTTSSQTQRDFNGGGSFEGSNSSSGHGAWPSDFADRQVSNSQTSKADDAADLAATQSPQPGSARGLFA